ncbi:MAG TPA: tetratricopeptide repeat protein, partial [Chthoniobacterales bacterium]
AEAAQKYSDFLSRFPGHAYVSQVMLERGLAHKAARAYPAALQDFDAIIGKTPPTKEREVALLQKALLLGEQKDYGEMAGAFAQLIQDYPQTAAAAQANFWIGWAAYESKDYPAALPALKKARELDAKNYGDRAGLRIILAYYYLEDADEVAKQIAEHPVTNLPGEVYQWLAAKYLEAKAYAKAEKFLELLASGTLGPVSAETHLSLAQARLEQKKYAGAVEAAQKFLDSARDPLNRARGLMLQAEAELGQSHYDAAAKRADECLLLQPEGAMNAQARLLSGRILAARGDNDEAARAFMTIAVLYDDPQITPDALKRAAAAYQKAGNALEAQNALKELEKRYPDQLQKKDFE